MPLDISNATASLLEDFEAADHLTDEIYNKYFAKYFKLTSDLESKFNDTDVPIADSQIERILVEVPLNLYLVSANLAQFKQHNEIVKLTNKQRKKAKLEEDIDFEYQLMSIIYNSVIDRVESQITFTKELIMGAKKVWDARKRTEVAVPIKERDASVDLPPYPFHS